MTKKKLPKSVRKYIRQEKARIRREVLNLEEQKRLIQELYEKFPAPETKFRCRTDPVPSSALVPGLKKYENKRNL